MTTYTVHEEPVPRADRIDRGERLVFVKDGFSAVAAYLGPIWLLTNRLWLALLGYGVVIAVCYGALHALGAPSRWLATLIVALHVVIGFEADTFKRFGLERRGWRSVGTVTGRNTAECERRFFDDWLPGEPLISTASRELVSTPPRAQSPPEPGASAPAGPDDSPRSAPRRWFAPFKSKVRAPT